MPLAVQTFSVFQFVAKSCYAQQNGIRETTIRYYVLKKQMKRVMVLLKCNLSNEKNSSGFFFFFFVVQIAPEQKCGNQNVLFQGRNFEQTIVMRLNVCFKFKWKCLLAYLYNRSIICGKKYFKPFYFIKYG